jgi:hypothetical protein
MKTHWACITVSEGPTKERPGTFVECLGVWKECPGKITLIITLVINKITYFIKDQIILVIYGIQMALQNAVHRMSGSPKWMPGIKSHK